MLLILMRHGIAEDGAPDAERALTAEGRTKVEKMAGLLQRIGIEPAVFLSSPRVRARQTAETVIKTMGLKLRVRETEALDFTAPWEQFEEAVNEAAEKEPGAAVILASGHQPHMGELISMALFGSEMDLALKKASCTGISFDERVAPGEGELAFHLTPKMARSLVA
jgi:phosphohistidine phosphatase